MRANSGDKHRNRLKNRIISNIILQLLPVNLSDRNTSLVQSNLAAFYDAYAVFAYSKRTVNAYELIRRQFLFHILHRAQAQHRLRFVLAINLHVIAQPFDIGDPRYIQAESPIVGLHIITLGVSGWQVSV